MPWMESVLLWGSWMGLTFPASTEELEDSANRQISTVSPTAVTHIYHPRCFEAAWLTDSERR